ncbi:MAG: AraC family transcriptional regulator [Lachnospiraceae bacterium]|jgi:AraC family transcriptional regulator, melibiose operon regulatory protein|nr:AraC family transcriptional regulator [Lachnospiraceae bacterium]
MILPVVKQLDLDENRLEKVRGLTNEYPYAMHVTDYARIRIPWHWHEAVELKYQMKGCSDVVTNHTTYRIHAGEGLFLNSNVLSCSYRTEGEKASVSAEHIFHPVLLSGHFHSVFETRYINPIIRNPQIEGIVITEDIPYGKEMLKKLLCLNRLQEKEHVEMETRCLLSEIWLLLYREIQENGVSGIPVDSQDKERILSMMTYIHQHYPESITLEGIASSAGVSKRECLRCFKKNLDRTPFDYLLSYRLQRACEILTDTDHQITEVALETGLGNCAHFGKVFKNEYGMSPGRYRKESSAAKE